LQASLTLIEVAIVRPVVDDVLNTLRIEHDLRDPRNGTGGHDQLIRGMLGHDQLIRGMLGLLPDGRIGCGGLYALLR